MNDYPPLSPWSTGFKGRCPRCGEGRLFAKYLKIAPSCPACGLDLSKEDSGDGAIPFIILVTGFVGVGLGIWLQLTFDPPVWVQIAVTFPVIIGLTLAMMPPLKGLLIALQYVHRAGDTQGTFDDDDETAPDPPERDRPTQD